ncbi:hypothetical protein CH373_15900 [Leptospira perolatii]|uniref:Uncharacterized protein n=1 Tax=Leptospira perolatii TaxID=2023191 RepID=A0A2M9ZJ86_9LEPT|nr:hypothetical protein [Leptospira perolatii]PJZ72081.1 hypothetical protein CH373_15900 [Leptospira perolatii]
MAKSKKRLSAKGKKKGFWSKLFFWRKKLKEGEVSEEKAVRDSRGYTWELKDLREKVDRFFLTRKKPSGPIYESPQIKLSKTNRHLFRLEGKEKSGREYSIVVATGNFLTEQNGKVSGVLFMGEADLNRLLSADAKSLKSLLSGLKDPKWEGDTWSVLEEEPDLKRSSESWKEILNWEPIWKQQVLIRLRPSTIAVLLVFLGKEFESIFQENSAKRLKDIVSKELYFLNVSGNRQEPYSENLSLYEFEAAKRELENILSSIRSKREK